MANLSEVDRAAQVHQEELRRLAQNPTPEAAADLLEQWDGYYNREDAWRAK